MENNVNLYMGIPEVSEYLNIPRSETYKLVKTPQFPSVKIGKRWRVNKNALDKWFLNKAKTK